jgi:hypothetical protein
VEAVQKRLAALEDWLGGRAYLEAVEAGSVALAIISPMSRSAVGRDSANLGDLGSERRFPSYLGVCGTTAWRRGAFVGMAQVGHHR